MQLVIGISAISFAFLSTCWAGNATNDFDPDVDFTQYKAFTIIGGLDPAHSGWLDEPDMHERFKNFVSGALETRGLVEVPVGDKASLAVRFWVARRQKEDVTVTGYGASYMWGGYPPYWTGAWGYSYEEYVVHNYAEGTLVVDLIDTNTKDLVWRTILKQTIKDRAKAYIEAKQNLYKAMAILPPSASAKDKMRRERAKLASKYQ
jgi:Domain of unknown function (DUF4136)